MAYEDEVRVCVDCGQEFTFSANEQRAFERKGFHPPKRCPACRKRKRERRRNRSRDRGGEYRSPAFRDSAPQSRGRSPRHGSGSGRGRRRGEYRSPAFRDLDKRGRGLYRSPAFRDQGSPDDEYRAPGFRDARFSADDEYRAPGLQEPRRHYTDERPMFLLVCSECGEKQMVPFLPEEKENPLCDACYAKSSEESES